LSGQLAKSEFVTDKMLRASRVVCASKRGFATVVDAASGFKVAAVDHGQASSSVTVLLKAGSRYQSKPGVAHVLSNFAFKVRLLSTVDDRTGCGFFCLNTRVVAR
jgi:hypothetical protein